MDAEDAEVALDPSLQIFFAYIFEFIALVLFEKGALCYREV